MRQAILLLQATARIDEADEAAAAGDLDASEQMMDEAMDLIEQARKLAEKAMMQ